MMNLEENKEMTIEEFKEQYRMQFVQDQFEDTAYMLHSTGNQTNEAPSEPKIEAENLNLIGNEKRRKYKIFSQETKELCLEEVNLFIYLFYS